MKALPNEGQSPSKSSGRGRSNINPQLVRYTIAVKKVSRRLGQFADHDLDEKSILALLDDTRSQVLSLHIARKQLKNNHKRKHRNRT